MKKTFRYVVISLLLFSTIAGTQFINATLAQVHPTIISIKADGSVEGTDKLQRNGNIYTLSADLSGAIGANGIFITIQKDGIIFDGDHKTIQGTGNGIAIAAYGRKDITIKNTRIINFGVGIELQATDFQSNTTASNNQILDNYIDTTYFSISLNTHKGTVSGNTLTSRTNKYGILFDSNNTILSNNTFLDGGLIIYEPRIGNSLSGNTINGKPLVYLEHQPNQIIDGAAQVILTDCRNMTVRNVNTTADLRVTITLFGTTNTKITSCRGNVVLTDSHSNTIVNNQLAESGSMVSYKPAAIELLNSYNNTIAGNSIQATGSLGISLVGSSYNKMQDNQISSTGQAGISLESTLESKPVFNYIHENNITCTENGLYFWGGGRDNYVYKNLITDCKNAVMLSNGYENTFAGNNISRSAQYAVSLSVSDDNTFYHNNFVDNAAPAYEQHQFYYPEPFSYYSERNKWDNGEEGNYWSNYAGFDEDGDGIGETPYPVYENFTDRYPLTTPFNIDSITIVPETWNPQPSPEPTITPTQSTTPEPTHSPEPTPTGKTTEPFQTTLLIGSAVAVVVVVGLGLLVYFKKRPPKTGEKKSLKKTLLMFRVLLMLLAVMLSFPSVARANPWPGACFDYDAAPLVSLHSPVGNQTYAVNNILVNFTITKPEKWLGEPSQMYSVCKLTQKLSHVNVALDGKYYMSITTDSNLSVPLTQSVTLTDLTDGTHSVIIYVYAHGVRITTYGPGESYIPVNASSELVFFTVDATAPIITVFSPENKVYATSTVSLDFAVSELSSHSSYALDGKENMTITGNTTLTELQEGEHNIVVYATDEAGNTGTSETVYFNIDVPESFPTTLLIGSAVAAVAVVGLGLLIFLKKRRREAGT